MAAAVEAGAALVGLVFYPPSTRAVTPAQGAVLAKPVPPGVVRTGLLVDAVDETIAHILDEVPLEHLQLPGRDSPHRLAAVKARLGLPVMTVWKLAHDGALGEAHRGTTQASEKWD